MNEKLLAPALAAAVALMAGPGAAQVEGQVTLGPRPLHLVDAMDPSALKDSLQQCAGKAASRSEFSVGHRGAPLLFPEHTVESYVAAARMGAGVLECDVTFTQDRQLVCRHAQCDLHTTTNILATDLAAKCTEPFTPAASDTRASAKCCTSDLTLAEFRTLEGKMDGADPEATTVEQYLMGTAPWRTDLHVPGTLLTHAESIELFRSLGAKFTPELKAPEVEMPFEGDYSQADYAQQLIDEYQAAGVSPDDVFAQSFNRDDVLYWIANEPEFGANAVYLDDRYDVSGFDPNDPGTFSPTMAELAEQGVQIVAPPTFMLVTVEDGRVVPSAYARAAKEVGLRIITWTLERSGPLADGGGWYYQSIAEVIDGDGDVYDLLHVLAQDVGVVGVFADWPATVTYYANCFDLP